MCTEAQKIASLAMKTDKRFISYPILVDVLVCFYAFHLMNSIQSIVCLLLTFLSNVSLHFKVT